MPHVVALLATTCFVVVMPTFLDCPAELSFMIFFSFAPFAYIYNSIRVLIYLKLIDSCFADAEVKYKNDD